MNLFDNSTKERGPQCKLIATLNKMGYCFDNLTSYGERFLEYCESVDGPVLDVGATYGIATLRALRKGAFVVANDIASDHLKVIL